MGSWKSNSLEHINMQFKSIMEGMGIDEEKQHKLATKLNLSKKIKTITSMQTLEERKRKIKEYVNKLDNRNSVLNLLSLCCSLESGPRVLYDIFTAEKGHEVLINCMGRMDEEFTDAICDTLYTIITKYGNGFPPFLKLLLDNFLAGKIRDPNSFFKVLEFLVKENKADELFLNIDHNRCVCNTYFSKVIGYIGHLQKIDSELNFLQPLLKSEKAMHVKYILFISEFHQLEPRIVNKKVYEEISKEIKVQGKKGCRTDRIYEILKIADTKNVLDVVCCIVEAFVFGDRSIFKDVEIEIERSSREIEESKKCTEMLEEKMHLKNGDGSEAEGVCSKPTGSKAKVPKKIVKKVAVKNTLPSKSYVQVKWVKMAKGNTIWKAINLADIEGLFLSQEFDVFEMKVEKAKASASALEQKKPMIFSEKKNYAINIALGRVRISNSDLKSAILNLQEDFDENLVKQLLFYFPSDDEVEQFQSAESVFGRGEEFFKECIDSIEMIKRCLYYLYFIITFRNQNIGKSVEILKKYYTMLLTSNALKRFLGVALFAGNYLNKGTFLGNAEGFAMESIPTVLELKNKDSSFMDLLMEKIDKKQLIKDLSVVYDVSNINFEALCVEMEELKKNYINASGSSFKKIQERMDKALPRYEAICSGYDDVVRLHKDCEVYFGENVNEGFNSRIMMLLDRLSCKP